MTTRICRDQWVGPHGSCYGVLNGFIERVNLVAHVRKYGKEITVQKTEVLYAEQCRRPEWQKKRLEIMERDGWACIRCGKKDRTLHVHHRYYVRGRDVWDYPVAAYMTLCNHCHKDETKTEKIEGRVEAAVLDMMFGRFGNDALLNLYDTLLGPDAPSDDVLSAAIKTLDPDLNFHLHLGWIPQ